MIPIDQQIRRRNSLLASYSSSSISSANTIITSNNDIISRRMSLPGSLRPLKKRRVVSITDFQDDNNSNINAALTLSTMNSININAALTLSTMNTTTATKKNVSWNDLNGNIIHSQDDYHNHVFNDRDIWYTVSIKCVCLFVCLFIHLSVLSVSHHFNSQSFFLIIILYTPSIYSYI